LKKISIWGKPMSKISNAVRTGSRLFKNIFPQALFVVSLVMLGSVKAQEFEAGNKIQVRIISTVNKNLSGLFEYSYKVISLPSSRQDIWNFLVVFNFPKDSIIRASAVLGWWGPDIPVNVEPPYWVSWTGPGSAKVKPGWSKDGFRFETSILPGITDFYTEGYHEAPNFPEGMAPDSIPGYTNLTPYGPGIVGKTVGPVLPPEPFVALAFLDTLASYKHQAASLGWVGQEEFLKQLNEKLEQSRDQLSKGHIKQARDKIEEFVKKLENEAKKTEKDQDKKNDKKWVTSEGHALLKFNAEYLIEKLDEQITKRK
jgi:hypothetical protein